MRITTVFRRLLGVTQMYVEEVWFSETGLEIRVRPSWRRSRCSGCGGRAARYDRRPERGWRHLSWGRVLITLRYAPWRVACRECGVRVESVSWARPGGRFTSDFEEMVAYLAQVTDRTRVCRLMKISWAAVGAIVERVVARRLDADRFQGLRRIGIDEFSYRKRHRYLTIVVDHDRRRVVWAGVGRSAETLQPFFDLLGETACGEIEEVTIDMAGGYLKAIGEKLSNAQVVFDRFHVERLAADAVDEVRRALVRELGDGDEAKAIKGLRFVLLKHPDRLAPEEVERLADVRKNNRPLHRAWELKDYLGHILELPDLELAQQRLDHWIAWAVRSRLEPFVKLSRTVSKYKEGILAYIQTKLTNGLVEGLNAKLRLIARRAFGFHSPKPLIAMLFLCCGGIHLNPPLPTPT